MLYSRMFVYQDRSGLISSRPILSYGPPLGLLLVRDILPLLEKQLDRKLVTDGVPGIRLLSAATLVLQSMLKNAFWFLQKQHY